MTDREKLIKLLEEAEKEWFVPMWIPPNERQRCLLMHIADCLLDNGVIFAPDTTVGGKWIPVTERLPKDGVQVLSCTRHGKPFPAHCKGGKWRVSHSVTITHWMPMPEPPKGD